MGWTFFDKPNNVKAWFEDILTWENDNVKVTCLKSCLRVSRAFAAVEKITKETGKREVFAAIFLLRYTRDVSYNFGYKDMDENMGPCVCDCPKSILDLLTPTDNKYAKRWRQRAETWDNRTKPVVGDIIRVEEYGVFRKIKYGNYRNIYKNMSDGSLARFRPETVAESTIIGKWTKSNNGPWSH